MHALVRRGQKLHYCANYFVKACATAATNSSNHLRKKCSYDNMLQKRQVEAQRSIVVQVSSEKSYNELYNYCQSFGDIIGAHHYSVKHDDELHYILIEFSNTEEATAAISCSAYNEDLTGVPVHSPFLWFRAAAAGKKSLKSAPSSSLSNTPTLTTIDGARLLSNDQANTLLHEATDVEAQIYLLHQNTQLNDIGVRLRFLAALQVQQAISGMFPAANAQPFGSSVNGFGKMGCDLDLILRFDREITDGTTAAQQSRRRKESRLVFHTKEHLGNGRSQTQRQMECISDMLQLFLPGVCHVRRILQARVPIIKYHHEHLNLEVDLSMSNLTGFYMSELLYMFGELDERVRPLTFCIRRWANACGLTNPSPGRWITNFSLTCLVMFFLQQTKRPILPAINTLMKSATKEDMRITEDGINCTFGRDFERINFQSNNTSKISELLLQFFEFYSQFDFGNRAISLLEGRALTKPDHSPLYIVNPLEQLLNVSKNVSLEECERLRIEVRNAAWVLESEVENATLSEQEKCDKNWGLLNLFRNNERAILSPNMFFKPRMVEVSQLFQNGEQDAAQDTADAGVSYKNEGVRQQVKNIKADTRYAFKQLRAHANGTSLSAAHKGRKSR